jgi:hypothetical protein
MNIRPGDNAGVAITSSPHVIHGEQLKLRSKTYHKDVAVFTVEVKLSIYGDG